MATLCFYYFIFPCFEIYFAYVGVFSHLVKDVFYLFVKMPIKSTRQQTIVCVENLVTESLFLLLSYNQLVLDQRFKMDFCETIKSITVSAECNLS